MLPVDAIIAVDPAGKVKAGDVIARIPTESAKTRDITGGLPRVAELFEARRPKEAAIIAEVSGTIQFGRDYKNKRRVSIIPDEEGLEPIEYLIPKGKHIHLQDGDHVEKGDFILEGPPAPHDILAVKGVEELAAFLVNEIQEVYRLQGVNINDKHIETIVRQMLRKYEIQDPGDSDLLAEEQVDKVELDEINAMLAEQGKKLAVGVPVLLGITKASLQTRSFVSAASFQETTRVLTEAAVNGKVDTLDGLKENVIVGRLIPAGTGQIMSRIREVATRRDDLIVAAAGNRGAERCQRCLPGAAGGGVRNRGGEGTSLSRMNCRAGCREAPALAFSLRRHAWTRKLPCEANLRFFRLTFMGYRVRSALSAGREPGAASFSKLPAQTLSFFRPEVDGEQPRLFLLVTIGGFGR